jgi:hypothetical protein
MMSGLSTSAGADAGSTGQAISFLPPSDFATNATPGATAAFNAAAGDQVALLTAGGIAGTPLTLLDSVAVGDFDHDNDLDVAQTNVIAGSVSVFLGDGAGGFGPAIPYPVGVNPLAVIAADLNEDAHLDLVVANFGSSNLTVLRGEGKNGIFRPVPVPLAPPPGSSMAPRNVAVGEFNGDGILDLAVSGNQRLNGSSVPNGQGLVAILTGQEIPGSGRTFSAAYLQASSKPNVGCVAVGNFDGVGGDDIAVGVGRSGSAGDGLPDDTPTGDDVLVFLNGSGKFGASPDRRIRVGASPNAIAVADLNRDGRRDLAVAEGSATLTVLLGAGQGRFVAKKPISTGSGPLSAAVGDFNGDGIPDLATANFTDGQCVSVLAGKGDGSFQPSVEFWAGETPTGVASGDFNGDGRVDLAAGRLRTDELALLLNDSPREGDGVRIDGDLYYGRLPTDSAPDYYAAHHTLDVYTPPAGTPSFAGAGRRYPVVFFVHGGSGTAGDKSGMRRQMRSFASEGIVAVSINYRLGVAPSLDPVVDVAHAFRWVYDHAAGYGGDRNNLFWFGHSGVISPLIVAAIDPSNGSKRDWLAEQGISRSAIRGAVLAGGTGVAGVYKNDPLYRLVPTADQPPLLLLNGTEGTETGTPFQTASTFYAASEAVGAEVEWQIIPGRDHFTLLSNLALTDDLGRAYLLDFLRRHLSLGIGG